MVSALAIHVPATHRSPRNVERSAELRNRAIPILNHLVDSRGISWEEAESVFANEAVKIARISGMKSWKNGLHSAIQSVQTLLGEKTVRKANGVQINGSNAAWVSDIFEATIEEFELNIGQTFNGSKAAVRSAESVFDTMREVKRVSDEIAKELERPLSMRLIEAYVERNDDSFMQLVLSVETLEQGR
jgi:hypothetical protein